MRSILSLMLATASSLMMSTYATTPAQIAERLSTYNCITGSASYEVTLPSSADPVTYTVKLFCAPPSQDKLAPCQYLIDWELPRPRGTSHGFAAYYDGNHFRYRDNKLQEYHISADSIPFHTGTGVQNQAQFVELLPPYLSEKIHELATDSTYIWKVRENADNITIEGRRRIKGYDAFEFSYVFDTKSLLPVSSDFTYNPASISEQIVTATYHWTTDGKCPDVTEKMLISLYPEVFEKFRISNFRVENLTGTELPEFTAHSTDGQRYIHHRGEPFNHPTLIVFIDPAVESTDMTIADVRKAVMQSPTDFDILFVTAEKTLPENVLQGGADPAETFLTGASKLVRECGITAYPTFIFADRDGTVKDVLTSYNKELPTVVIQKMTLCN